MKYLKINPILFLSFILVIVLLLPMLYSEPFKFWRKRRSDKKKRKEQAIINKVGKIVVSNNKTKNKMQMLNEIDDM